MTEYLQLLLPIALIFAGLYLKFTKKDKSNSYKNSWFILLLLGIGTLIIRIILMFQ